MDYGAERRRLRVKKMRGINFRGGYHDYIIETGGIKIFPRLVAAEHHKAFVGDITTSGVTELDTLLGGGLERGTSALLVGGAGVGKSSIAVTYAVGAARRGEHVAMFAFDEGIGTLFARAAGLGVNLQEYVDRGLITVRQIDPAEMSPGEFTQLVRDAVEQHSVRVLLIDSLNGYLNAMPDERFLVLQMHELLAYLNQLGILTIMVLAQHGMLGQMQTPIDLSYLSDAVIMLRYFEAQWPRSTSHFCGKKTQRKPRKYHSRVSADSGGCKGRSTAHRVQWHSYGNAHLCGEPKTAHAGEWR